MSNTLEENILGFAAKEGINPTGTCCICGKEYVLGGYNPFPVVEDRDARCCRSCDKGYVLPTRRRMIQEASRLRDFYIKFTQGEGL